LPDPEAIAGVRVVELTTHSDVRGGFTEVFRQDWFPDAPPMAQSCLSRSRPGVLRGMHFHRQQADYWCFTEGRAFVVLFDLRSGSPTERRVQTMELDAAERLRGIYLPPGIAHGFFTRSEVTLHYLVDRTFDAIDEFGFAWNDPGLAVDWPTTEPTLSERDGAAPALAGVLADPPQWPAVG
jgi:dTDP-4-dehydrorhamnose 3,5-epimerase